MNIRPIDLQVIIPHATDIGKMQATQNNQQITQQQQFAEQLQRQAAEQQGQVQGTLRVEMPRVHRDKEGGAGNQPSGRQHGQRERRDEPGSGQPDKPMAADAGCDPVRGKKIDIML